MGPLHLESYPGPDIAGISPMRRGEYVTFLSTGRQNRDSGVQGWAHVTSRD